MRCCFCIIFTGVPIMLLTMSAQNLPLATGSFENRTCTVVAQTDTYWVQPNDGAPESRATWWCDVDVVVEGGNDGERFKWDRRASVEPNTIVRSSKVNPPDHCLVFHRSTWMFRMDFVGDNYSAYEEFTSCGIGVRAGHPGACTGLQGPCWYAVGPLGSFAIVPAYPDFTQEEIDSHRMSYIVASSFMTGFALLLLFCAVPFLSPSLQKMKGCFPDIPEGCLCLCDGSRNKDGDTTTSGVTLTIDAAEVEAERPRRAE